MDGLAVMSSNRVAGRPVLRPRTVDPRTRVEEVDELVERLGRIRGGIG